MKIPKHYYHDWHGKTLVECCREDLTDCPYFYLQEEIEGAERVLKRCASIPCSYYFEQKIDKLIKVLDQDNG